MAAIGDIVRGTVKGCESFGALIQHHGIDYFIPLHELSWQNLRHASDVLTVGNSCEFIVDRPHDSPAGAPLGSVRRVHPEQNPWANPTLYSVGTQFSGPITVKREFGWFIRHPRGIEVLLHADDIPPQFRAEVGESVDVEIIHCDVENQKVRVALST